MNELSKYGETSIVYFNVLFLELVLIQKNTCLRTNTFDASHMAFLKSLTQILISSCINPFLLMIDLTLKGFFHFLRETNISVDYPTLDES